jgi:hypothetical protein
LCELLFSSLRDRSPSLCQHLTATLDLNPNASFSSFLLSLGLYTLPLPLALQVIDLFLLEGEVAVRRIVVGAVILSESELRRCEDQLEAYKMM